jgi:hypothetical protein
MNKLSETQIAPLPRYLNIKKICELFSLGKDQVWNALLAGELKGSKPGRQIKDPKTGKVLKTVRGKNWIVPAEEVVRWVKKWEVEISTEVH